jgi:Short C-terminal domain
MMRRRGMGVIGTAVVVGGAAHMGAKSANKQAAAQDQAQQDAYEQGLAAAQQQAAVAPAPAAAPAVPDDAAEIQKYAAMLGQGLITQEEFEAKKKQILGI